MGGAIKGRAVSKAAPCEICGGSSHCSRWDAHIHRIRVKNAQGVWVDDYVHADVGQKITCMRASSGRVAPTAADWRQLSKGPGKNGGLVFVHRDLDERGTAPRANPEAWKAQKQAETRDRLFALGHSREFCGRAIAHSKASGWTVLGAPEARGYFAGRGIDLNLLPGGALPPAIKFLPSENFNYRTPRLTKRRLEGVPCVVCLAVREGHEDGPGFDGVIAAQRIFLDPQSVAHGAPIKLRVPVDAEEGTDCKRLTYGESAGAAVRLDYADSAFKDATLVLCEGIETGIAIVAATAWTVWACISTSGLQSVLLPEWLFGTGHAPGPVARIIVAGDHDHYIADQNGRPGAVAALKAIERLRGIVPAWVKLGASFPTREDAPARVGTAPGANDHFGDVVPSAKERDAGKTEGKSCDWLDVLTDSGAEAVKRGLLRAMEERQEHAAAVTSIGAVSSGRGWSVLDEDEGQGHGDGHKDGADDGAADGPVGIVGSGDPENAAIDQAGGGEGAGGHGGGTDGGGREPRILPADDLRRAWHLLRDKFTPRSPANERWLLAWHQPSEQFMLWDASASAYRWLPDQTLRNIVRAYFRPWKRMDAKGNLKPSALGKAALDGVIDALRVEVDTGLETIPAMARATFISDGNPILHYDGHLPVRPPAAVHVIAVRNGLMWVDEIEAGRVRMRAPTTRYVSTSTLPFDIDAAALQRAFDQDPDCEVNGGEICERMCPSWMAFLRRVWDGDAVSQLAIQQFFGLTLTPDKSFEKALALIGPPASGKGTIIDALTAMHGQFGIAMSAMSDLSKQFGFAPLLGKNVVIFDELASGSGTDLVEATRRLKTVIGNARVSADLKHRDQEEFALITAKMVMAANELPKFPDPSAAMSRRLVVLPMTESFQGKEDLTLKPRIKAEAAGILHWAILGLRSLYRAGKFEIPEDGLTMIGHMRRMAAPVFAFLEDGCVIGPGHEVRSDLLFRCYKAYAEHNGFEAKLSKERFGAMLMAAVPGMRQRQETVEAGGIYAGQRRRVRLYQGLRPWMRHDRDSKGDLPLPALAKDASVLFADQLADMEWWDPRQADAAAETEF